GGKFSSIICAVVNGHSSRNVFFEKVLSEVYADAVKQAVIETELSKNTFLDECPFTTAQIMDENFPPEMIQE
ncbi:MAG: DUF29 family protein, partial [Cyanobacteria bacterium J06628_6]